MSRNTSVLHEFLVFLEFNAISYEKNDILIIFFIFIECPYLYLAQGPKIGMQTDRGIPATRGDPIRADGGIPALAGNGSGMELDFHTRSGDGSGTGIMVSAPFKTRYIYIYNT